MNLSVFTLAADTTLQSVCSGDTLTWNGRKYYAAGVYSDTLRSIHGCDSITVLSLSITQGFSTQLYDTICQGTAFSFKDSLFSISGRYYEALTSSSGCDSLVTLNLHVIPQPLEPYIVQQNSMLVAPGGYTSYQWYLNDTALAGDTGLSIIPVANGNYAVDVSGGNGCFTMSAPFNYLLNNIGIVCCDFDAIIYPNPNNGNFVLEFSDNIIREVIITDMLGQSIMPMRKVTGKEEFDLSAFAAGIYLLKISDVANNGQVLFRQVVVQH